MENINSVMKIPEGSFYINNSIYTPINISNNSLFPNNTNIYKGKIYILSESKENKQNNTNQEIISENNGRKKQLRP